MFQKDKVVSHYSDNQRAGAFPRMKIRISLIFSLASMRVVISVGSALELKMGELNVLFIYEKVIYSQSFYYRN